MSEPRVRVPKGLTKAEHLAELEAALRSDARVLRAQSGTRRRLNYDDAADVCAEYRAALTAARTAMLQREAAASVALDRDERAQTIVIEDATADTKGTDDA